MEFFTTTTKQEEPKKATISAVGVAFRIESNKEPRTYGDATETGVGTGIYKNVSR